MEPADEPDDALKRSLQQPVIGDRGLLAFFNRRAGR
jgi:hypothetical protein